ncbi:fumarylacetoacetate hydrolase family protein [Arthrobacter sp. C9C5]|uniref:fumarylacetoacetate hydrolase family protein n=1 Tax=Arthrobacter sp. C9C5 TaxID=2735267 RepID=UPI0015855B69|nr:fumarylacetoacetate hydrolase family protein [Arthrobacter sp. C9C5]NUU32934.1 fumarylacetoacetate hydrolase family protein [Arthrobacter sp. C9C5]
MAYANYRYKGQNFIGEVHGDHLVPLDGLTDVGPETSTDLLARAARLAESRVALADVTLRAASPRAGKILCVGLNYKDHAGDASTAAFPVLFPKYTSTLVGPDDDIILPPESSQVDFEGELAVIIGKTGRRIAEQDATGHILGYCVSNDVTMRDFQNKSHQWLQDKVWDDTTPLGPYIVTPAEADISKAGISTTLNGQVVQESDLSHLIFSIPALIATISEFTTLEPGDVILTGTPAGVGYRREPPLFLKDGDTITVAVEGVGSITNTVRAEAA